MRWHKLKQDGPLAITITEAKLGKGKFGPELVVKGKDGSGDVGVSLSPLGALKQFYRLGIGAPTADALPQDQDMPEYHGTFRIELEEAKDGKSYTRIERIADDDFERMLDGPSPLPPASTPMTPVAKTTTARETATERYARLLPSAIGFATEVAEAGFPAPDVNAICATLMIDEQRRS
jgi:hypothetical protein